MNALRLGLGVYEERFASPLDVTHYATRIGAHMHAIRRWNAYNCKWVGASDANPEGTNSIF